MARIGIIGSEGRMGHALAQAVAADDADPSQTLIPFVLSLSKDRLSF